MKIIPTFLLLLLSNFAKAQNEVDILFTKGTQLEYQTFIMPNPKRDYRLEITHITLNVTDVKDSNNVLLSYITKKGTGIVNPDRDHYEKRYVLRKEGSKVSIPVDLFNVDTFYLADKYLDKDEKGYHSASKLRTSNYYILDFSKNVFECSPKTITADVAVRYYLKEPMFEWRNGKWEVNGGRERQTLDGSKFTVTSSIDCKIGDKTSVKTPAGDFECYKLMLTRKMSSIEVSEIMYFNPKSGLIKMEPAKREKANIFVELQGIKQN